MGSEDPALLCLSWIDMALATDSFALAKDIYNVTRCFDMSNVQPVKFWSGAAASASGKKAKDHTAGATTGDVIAYFSQDEITPIP